MRPERILALLALSLFTAGGLAATDTPKVPAGSYSLKTTKSGIRDLFLDDYPMPAALKLFEQHVGVDITVDKAVQKQVKARRLSMSFQPTSWRNALIVLVVSERFHLAQSGPTHYHISAQGKRTESFDELWSPTGSDRNA